LEDPGFDFSVLSEFRSRLLEEEGLAERLLLEKLLAECKERGLLKARGKQRTDSTHVLAAVKATGRLECIGETVRATLNVLAVAAPEWLAGWVPPEWYERYGPRMEEFRLPKADAERKELAEQIGADGLRLLGVVDADDAPAGLRHLGAVSTMRRLWAEQYHVPEEPGGTVRLREPKEMPPAAQTLQSPYDPEARYSWKREVNWVGYKVHLTETCDRGRPNLITDVRTTSATVPDLKVLGPMHGALEERNLLPREHLVDSGYMGSKEMADSLTHHGVELFGPMPRDGSWQAKAGEGFDALTFRVDWDAKSVTCPEGKKSKQWKPALNRHGRKFWPPSSTRRSALHARAVRSARVPRRPEGSSPCARNPCTKRCGRPECGRRPASSGRATTPAPGWKGPSRRASASAVCDARATSGWRRPICSTS
jgi:transposase